MNIAVAALLAILQPGVVPPDAHPVLWQNVSAGMTRDQVRSLYPRGGNITHRDDLTIIEDYRVSEGCQATVRVFHERGSVDKVVVRGEGSIGGSCSDTVFTALSARYGEALSRDRRGGTLFGRESNVYVWNREGVTLRFRRFTNGMLGGAGLGAPSWELTYSLIATDVAL
jgi:hypothetical protein